ncbi:MAG TPA: putative ATP-grasp-modified RiPP [Actinocatenispora sp.]
MESTALAEHEKVTARGGAPFGLRFARRPSTSIDLDLDHVGYDEQAQVAIARDGDRWVPLIDHRMSVTLQTSGETPREDEIYDKSST